MFLKNCFYILFSTDPESHILFFDIEALIIELLSEEYDMMSPGSLEAAGLISCSEYMKVYALTQSTSPDAHKKIVGKYEFFYNLGNTRKLIGISNIFQAKHDLEIECCKTSIL